MACETKEHLLKHGEQLLLRRGYADTGIQDILKAAQVPKGSFYHFFESKEQFALEVLQRHGGVHEEIMRATLSDVQRSALCRLRDYFTLLHEAARQKQCRDGCLMGNLSCEMASSCEAFRQTLNTFWKNWQGALAACIREAQASGEVPRKVDSEAAGAALIEAWEGALMRSKLARDDEALDRFRCFTLPALLGVEITDA